MKVLQTAFSNHRFSVWSLVLLSFALTTTVSHAQNPTPAGFSKQHWNAVQDFWQYQARVVRVARIDDTEVSGLLLVTGEKELWVLPDTYWVLEQGEVMKIPIEEIKTIQLRKNPRLVRAALLGYLRTAIWSSPIAVAAADNELWTLSLLITLGIAAPMGVVFNTVYHGLVTIPYKKYVIQGKQEVYLRDAYPWMSRYTLLAQPEEYLQVDRETMNQYPDSWSSLNEMIPAFKTLFAPNLLSFSFGFNYPIWSNNQQDALISYLGTVDMGNYEYTQFSSSGGYSVGITADISPKWTVGLRSTLGFNHDGSYYLPSQDYYLSHNYRYDDVALMAGYYLLSPDPYLRRASSLEAQVGLGAVHSNFVVSDYDPVTFDYTERSDPQWGGAAWVGLQYAIRAHRWLYFEAGAHSRLSTPLQLPNLPLPSLGPEQGLSATDLPIHQFQLTFQASIMLHRPAKWALSK
ncbi:MAG: hypothetical protein AAFQ98_00660 [Bacteroidota bacterium]